MNDPRFPELTRQQINTLKEYGEIVKYDKEEVLWTEGDMNYPFYVILKGKMQIVDPSNDNLEIVVHDKYEFSGDSGLLTGRAAVVEGIVKPGTHLLKIPADQLHEIISKHSGISDVLLNAFLQRQETVLSDYAGGVKVIGSGVDKHTYNILDFMDKNHVRYTFLDIDKSKKAGDLLNTFNVKTEQLPVLINNEPRLYPKPSLEQIARCTGILTEFEDKIYDVLVVGAGPAGLAASVYAASEGLTVVTIDNKAPGGQAGKSSKIENYLGFPTGISGSDLANRAYLQAQKFGCNISIPHTAEGLEHHGDHFRLCATNGKNVKARALIIATGASYRRLPLDGIEKYEGSGVYYSATGMNIGSCRDEIVGVVGGGNSAGQAALFLANYAREVNVIIRGDDLGAKMSDYLVQRIEAAPNIHVLKNTNVVHLRGEYHLESVEVLNNKTREYKDMDISNLFTFVGAAPCTEWMRDLVITDKKGFICTGNDLKQDQLAQCHIYDHRRPFQLETSIPGLFAVGDVRKGSTKRVASAVGEGSICISQVHQYLNDLYNVQKFELPEKLEISPAATQE